MTSSATPIGDEEVAKLLDLAVKKNVTKQFSTELIAKLPQVARTQSLSNMGRYIESGVKVFAYKVDQTHSEALNARSEFDGAKTTKKKAEKDKDKEKENRRNEKAPKKEIQMGDDNVKKFQLPEKDLNVVLEDQEPFNPLFSKAVRRTGVTPGALLLANTTLDDEGFMRLHLRPFEKKHEKEDSNIALEDEIAENEALLAIMEQNIRPENKLSFTEDFQDFDSLWHCSVSNELTDPSNSKRPPRKARKTIGLETVQVLSRGSIEQPLYFNQDTSSAERGHSWSMPTRNLPLKPLTFDLIPNIPNGESPKPTRKRANSDSVSEDTNLPQSCFDTLQSMKELYEALMGEDFRLQDFEALRHRSVSTELTLLDPSKNRWSPEVSTALEMPIINQGISSDGTDLSETCLGTLQSGNNGDVLKTPARNMADESHWKTEEGSIDSGKTSLKSSSKKKPTRVEKKCKPLTWDDVNLTIAQRARRHGISGISFSDFLPAPITDRLNDYEQDCEKWESDLYNSLTAYFADSNSNCLEIVVKHKPSKLLEGMLLQDPVRREEVLGRIQTDLCCRSPGPVVKKELTFDELFNKYHKDETASVYPVRPKKILKPLTPKKLRTRTPMRPEPVAEMNESLGEAVVPVCPQVAEADDLDGDLLSEALHGNNQDLDFSAFELGNRLDESETVNHSTTEAKLEELVNQTVQLNVTGHCDDDVQSAAKYSINQDLEFSTSGAGLEDLPNQIVNLVEAEPGHHKFSNLLAQLGPNPPTATAMTILLHTCNAKKLDLRQERCPKSGLVKESALDDFDISAAQNPAAI